MDESKRKNFRGEAVRRINQCIPRCDTPCYSSETLKWSVTASGVNVEVTVTVGERRPEKVYLDLLFAATTDLASLRNALEALYARFIWGNPDLKERQNAAKMSAKIAKLCGARSDVVQSFTIERNPAYDAMLCVRCSSYDGAAIRQEFSTLLMEEDCADGVLESSISIMIKSLEGLKNAKQKTEAREDQGSTGASDAPVC